MSEHQTQVQAATRFWARGRVLFNSSLVPSAALGYFFRAGLSARVGVMPEITPGSALGLFACGALLANLCYSLAYVLELLLRAAPPDSRWSGRARAVALAVGTVVGMGAAFNSGHFIAMMQYPGG